MVPRACFKSDDLTALPADYIAILPFFSSSVTLPHFFLFSHRQYIYACHSLPYSHSSRFNFSLNLFQAFDGRWKKFGQPKFVYTVDVQLTLDQCRAVRIKPAEGRVEALSDTEGITANLGGIKGYNTIVDGLYDGTLSCVFLYCFCPNKDSNQCKEWNLV